MNFSVLLMGLLPLIVFVIVDSLSNLKAAIISAIVMASAEGIYSLVVFGEIDGLTIGSFVLIAIFGVISLKTNNRIYFKLQPAIIGVITAAIFLIAQYCYEPLLVMMMEKYQYIFPEQQQKIFQSPEFKLMMAKCSLNLGYGFLIHSCIVAFSAFKLSNLWWLLIRGIGLYVMMGICMYLAF